MWKIERCFPRTVDLVGTLPIVEITILFNLTSLTNPCNEFSSAKTYKNKFFVLFILLRHISSIFYLVSVLYSLIIFPIFLQIAILVSDYDTCYDQITKSVNSWKKRKIRVDVFCLWLNVESKSFFFYLFTQKKQIKGENTRFRWKFGYVCVACLKRRRPTTHRVVTGWAKNNICS